MDVVIVRENEEDLYAGIEYQMTPEVMSCIKLISRPGSEKIVRYAFEYARLHNRKKVTCFMKDNIMKMTDGLFHKVFDEIGAQYPDIEKEVWIVDIGAAKMADTPEAFDVIVMPNLYGDILSDVAAQIAGSVGLAGSANIGESCAMFEAIHGSAPRRAGQNLANPSGLLLGAVLMLVHIDQPEVAAKVHNAWLRTIEDGVHTYDIFTEGVSTAEGRDQGIRRGGDRAPRPEAEYPEAGHLRASSARRRRRRRRRSGPPSAMELKGIDVFVYWPSRNANALAEAVGKLAGDGLSLQMIDNRGVKVWPAGRAETFCTDSFRCRFMARGRDRHGQTAGCGAAHRRRGHRHRGHRDAAQFRRAGRVHPGAGTVAMDAHPLVGVIMGSKSDWDVMRQADEVLTKFGVEHECRVLSAHRTPKETAEYVSAAEGRGIEVIIAAAGGAAHLAGVCAAHTLLPVLGVPMESAALKGMDSLLSTVQMPAGIPVGTLAIGPAGARNAALLAIAILANSRPKLRDLLRQFRAEQSAKVLRETLP